MLQTISFDAAPAGRPVLEALESLRALEGRPGALNALVLWNAQYLNDAIAQLRATGNQITDDDLQRLSPLQHEHIKMLGHFPFTLPHDIAAGARRPLRQLGQAA